MYYSAARSTVDADFVIDFGDMSIFDAVRLLGPEFRLDPQITFETAMGTTRHIVDVVGTPYKIELFHLGTDPHDRSRFERRREVVIQEHKVFIPSPEDVVITKLRWLRAKDINDIQDVLAMQGARFDWDYVNKWCDEHQSRDALQEILAKIPSDWLTKGED